MLQMYNFWLQESRSYDRWEYCLGKKISFCQPNVWAVKPVPAPKFGAARLAVGLRAACRDPSGGKLPTGFAPGVLQR